KRITKILSVALILALTLTTLVLPASAVTNPFKDVPSNQYYYEPVLWAVGKGITNGTSATTFSPNQKCTRAQAVMFLWNAAGKPEPASNSNPFKDVPTNQYYYKAVLWAVGKGITSGTSKTEFSPNQGCTRGQIMTFVWRYAGMPSGAGTANPFKDVPTNQYYYQPVLWAVGKGITNGTSTTTFSPNQTCTRGQIMTFLYNYEVKVKNAAGGQQKPTPTPTPKPTPTPTPTPKPSASPNTTPEVKYEYSIFTFGGTLELLKKDNALYSDVGNLFYIETNNPNRDTYKIVYFGADGERIPVNDPIDDLDDVDLNDIKGSNKNSSGFVTNITFSSDDCNFVNGKFNTQIAVIEFDLAEGRAFSETTNSWYTYRYATNERVVAKEDVTVTDYTWAQNQAFDQIIAKTCTANMNPLQKMQAAVGYFHSLRDKGSIRYLPWVKGVNGEKRYVSLASSYGLPWFKEDIITTDSYYSPGILYALASHIGGFDAINNCYDDYPPNSDEWIHTHYYCTVTYNGITEKFEFCPSTDTGEISISKIDLTDPNNFMRLA
uniref:S-layer homology domain-containing protein n=1 Tax=uncultured Dysosmobacter sp. TaxID=2591384 RepID=UPI00263233C3